jgi:hypothetical protein
VEFLVNLCSSLIIQVLNLFGPGFCGFRRFRKQLRRIFVDPIFNLFDSCSVSLFYNA